MGRGIKTLLGVLVVVLLISVSCNVRAATQPRAETKTVYYRQGLKVLVNGEEVKFEANPFIVDPGWIMVQLEPVVRKMGGIAKWDDNASTLSITTQMEATPTANTVQTPASGSSITAPLKTRIADLLNQNLGTVTTELGTLKLTYRLYENDTDLCADDYWVEMDYGGGLFFYDLKHKVGVTDSARTATINALKSHAELVYRTVSALLPGKKIRGDYHAFRYKYPSLKVGATSDSYFNWANYEQDDTMFLDPTDMHFKTSGSNYSRAKITFFHWTPLYDDIKF
jgi:hypothetical protein